MSVKRAAEKQYWRQSMTQARQALSPQQREQYSRSICQQLRDHPDLREAQTIAAFYPTKDEADILPFLKEAYQDKTIALPRWAKKTTDLNFYKINEWKSLEERELGILQPTQTQFFVPPSSIEAILVPGLAFDTQGYRIGYGQGMYDRFLTQLPWSTLRIGICFSFQFIERVPREIYDVPVQEVICNIN